MSSLDIASNMDKYVSFSNTYPYLNPSQMRDAILRLRTDSFERKDKRTWAAYESAVHQESIVNGKPYSECDLRENGRGAEDFGVEDLRPVHEGVDCKCSTSLLSAA